MLTSIELTGFRGFRQLKLEGLQRVNLIVGKNNSGKTSLLEGIGTLDGPVGFDSLRFKTDGFDNNRWLIHDASQEQGAKINATTSGNSQLVRHLTSTGGFSGQGGGIKTCCLPVRHQSPEILVEKLGGALRHRGAEELIESVLKKVDVRIEKVRIIPVPKGNQVFVDIGLSELIPVSLIGQGVCHLLDIYSEIIGSNANICLIDEIETGIHHSSLIDLWRGIAEASAKFDVQIFATTHSHECIEAAHEAFTERDTYGLSVIQLFRKTISVQGRVLDQAHITAAMKGDIDLRE